MFLVPNVPDATLFLGSCHQPQAFDFSPRKLVFPLVDSIPPARLPPPPSLSVSLCGSFLPPASCSAPCTPCLPSNLSGVPRTGFEMLHWLLSGCFHRGWVCRWHSLQLSNYVHLCFWPEPLSICRGGLSWQGADKGQGEPGRLQCDQWVLA